MKNIYIEDAYDEKEPYLYRDPQNKFFTLPQLMDTYGKVLPFYQPINLYVVSLTEKIKEGDWAYEVNSFYPTGLPRLLKCKSVWGDEMRVPGGWRRQIKFPQTGLEMAKVVLTTDSKLIDDEVDSVDDEFVDWFIKDQKNYIELYEDQQCTYCGGRNCDNYYCKDYPNRKVFIPLLPHKIVKYVTTMYEDIVLKQEEIRDEIHG